jgi:hypothetical protein
MHILIRPAAAARRAANENRPIRAAALGMLVLLAVLLAPTLAAEQQRPGCSANVTETVACKVAPWRFERVQLAGTDQLALIAR